MARATIGPLPLASTDGALEMREIALDPDRISTAHLDHNDPGASAAVPGASAAVPGASATSGTKAAAVQVERPQRTRRQLIVAGCLVVGLVAFAGLLVALRPPIPPPPSPPSIRIAGPPSNDTEIVLLAHGSCANQVKDQAFWGPLLARAPQLFIFNGDIVYGDCEGAECPELTGAWDDLFANPNMRRAAAELPMVGILDDHDYGQNDGCVTNPWKGFAKAEYLRRFAIPPLDPRYGREGLHRSWSFGPPGRRLQLVLMDTRWSRSPYLPTDCNYCPGKERYVGYNDSGAANGFDGHDDGRRMLGDAQWAWLEGQLRQPAELRLLVSTVQVLAQGHGWERWGLIPAELRRLQRLIVETQAEGVVLLSGDRHVGGIYSLPGARGVGYDLYEVTASSLTHSYRGGERETEEAADGDEAVAGTRSGGLVHENHFGTVAVDWPARQVTFELVSADDCGVSAQEWGEQCQEHEGVPGKVLKTLTLSLDDLKRTV